MQDTFKFPLPTIDWLSVMPIILVACTGVLALVIEMLRPKGKNALITGACLIGLLISAFPLIQSFGRPEGQTFSGMVLRDRFGLIMQLLLILTAFLSILFSEGYLKEKRIPFGEFYPLVLWSTVGAMVMVSTQNLLMIFLGLEVLSIALYVMAGMSRSEEKSEESALKYFLLGAFATGFFLYGIAFLYGTFGTLHLAEIGQRLVEAAQLPNGTVTTTMAVFGLGLLLIGLCFKSAFVPFHQWTPDVYQGAPTNVTAFMAAGSKIAAIGALWRVLDATQLLSNFWMPVLFWIAILTMTVGNLVALLQKDVKRILGYSSISNAGYILVAVLAHFKSPQTIGIGTVTYFLFSYALMTIGSFAVVSLGAKNGREGTSIEDLYGMRQRSPLAAWSLLIFMISLIGIPPTAGFVGKFLIFQDALAAGLGPLAIVLAVNSIVSIYYYLGIARAAIVVEETKEASKMTLGAAGACLICAAGVVALAIFYTPITRFLIGGDPSASVTMKKPTTLSALRTDAPR